MSLLLDALKKAAQKKAKKSGAHDESGEPPEIADYENSVVSTQDDDTAINDTEALAPDSTLINQDTQISDTVEIEAITIDKKGVSGTKINEISSDTSQIDQDTLLSLDTTESEGISTDKTGVSDTKINKISPDQSQLDQDTQLFLDGTEIEAARIDEIEIEATSIDETDINIDFDEVDNDQTEVGEDIQLADKTEKDVTSLDETEIGNDTTMGYQSQLEEQTETLSIHAEDGGVLNEANGRSQAAFTDVDALYQRKLENRKEDLTEDDVTQFMGDGVSSRSSYDSDDGNSDTKIGDDDTTLTSPESLTLTNYSFTDQESEEPVTGRSIPDLSLQEYDGIGEIEETHTAGISQQDLPEDEKLTRINTDETSTVSAIDIEKLTNDETVTVGGSATTKTFAPDNYDRTLLNLSDKDVSNIFPGMQPDSDTVMTPDYAKRIFLSKSSQANLRYFKVYASIGIVSLLLVIMWGLFQLQEESGRVEQSLMSLKRDPMPGIIKPPAEQLAKGLFETQSNETDSKAIYLMPKAGEPAGGNEISQLENELDTSTVTGKVEERAAPSSFEKPFVDEQKTPVNVISSATKKPVQSDKGAVSGLMISSSSQVSPENQLLMEAYQAYELGDMTSAKELYNEVLSLDESNRDGLLGRAAIHVRDKEYQQAIDKYQQLLLTNPKDSMAMAALISVASIDPQAAETQLKSLLREQPELPYLHFVLGNMYGSQNRWSEAQSAYFEALQNKPDDPNYAYNLAVSLEHIGKAGAALTFYQRALENSSKGLVTFDNQLVMQRLEVLAQ